MTNLVNIGDLIGGKYEVLDKLGAGGMGQVFKARDHALDRDVAIKLINPAFAAEAGEYAIQSFIEEARLTAGIEHPHVLTVYNLDIHTNTAGLSFPYLVLQLYEGGSLADRLKRNGTFSPDACEAILDQICAGLDYAYQEKKIVHLDLKPGNILVDNHDNVKVADFGLAKILHGRQQADTGAGTPDFMPPEQHYGQDIGPFSDVYALGVTLHILLTGQIPEFDRNQPPYRILDPTLPPAIRTVIETAVHPDPTHRHQSAGEMALAFSLALHPARTPTAVPLSSKPAFLTPAPRPLTITTLDPQGVTELQQAMRGLGQFCADNPHINEREVVTYAFKQSGLFAALRYGEPGQDALLEHKHADVVLRATGGRVIGVLEFKRPAVPPQDGLPQLENQYVPLLLPDVGVLCNGRELIIYRRQGGYLVKPPVLQVDLATASEADARLVYQWLGKRQIDLAHLESYAQALQAFSQSPIPVQGPEEGGGRAFLERFALKPETVFGRLVEAMMQSLPDVMAESDFADGAYTFWKRIYARELKTADVPASWRPFLPNSQRETLYRFMFCLESAYALLARLLLARAMSNHRFPDLELEETLIAALRPSVQPGRRLPLTAYADGLRQLFIYTGNQAFETIFASDIFDWWQEIGKVASAQPLGERLAETVLAVFNFDFQPMTGDLLGSLYQSYFDAETRKALGEFYTPPEIVDFILDQVGYTASNPAIRQSRLLDPACGSGTFVIQAVRRYLQASQGQPPADVLLTLLGGLKIVGFDVNPFAVLMAQTNYAAQVIPLYAQAIQAAPIAADRLLRLPIPILRTDSLRQEYREGEQSQARAGSVMQPTLGLVFTQDTDVSIIQAELPVQVSPGQYYEAKIPVPRYDRARQEGWIGNPEEYFTALRVLFQAVAERKGREEQLRLRLEQAGLTPHAPALAHFMQPAARQLVEQMALLQQQYNDGRFLKTLADLALSLVLKGDVQYDYVVGNPPYIRVQTIPELLRRRWEGWYAWASGSFDAYIPFIERAVYIQPQVKGPVIREWLKPGGKMGYIIPNRFLLVNYAEKLRDKLPERTAVDLIFDFRDSRVFTAALNYPAILILRRLEDEEAASTTEFPAVRVFADPRKGAEELINETNHLLGHIAAGQRYVQGRYADAFLTDPASLNNHAWLLMPADERQVFAKIERAATILFANSPLPPTVRRLENLTLTQSGAFQGIATGDDPSLIFRLLEDKGQTLLLCPKGAEGDDWRGPQQVEIERELLRPWLFGRNVARWHIAWDGWYVFYPYAQITALEKQGGTAVPVTRWRLLPATGTEKIFRDRHKYRGTFPLIDQTYPLAWQYVNHLYVRSRLEEREGGKRFSPGQREAHQWYALGYPRNLEYYARPKLLMQVASPEADFAYDVDQHFLLQHGGRGGGTDGLLFNEDQDNWFLLGLLNSRLLDFYLKHISPVFSGKTYSYSDAFIKQYPIKPAVPNEPAEQAAAIATSQLAQELSAKTQALRAKERERDAFPVAQVRARSILYEVYYLHQLVHGQPQARTFHRHKVQFQSRPNGAVAMKFGGTTLVLPHIGIQQVIEAWLRLQSRSTLEVDDLMQLRLPSNQTACIQLLDALHTLEQEIATLQADIQTGEQMLNNTVATFYGLDAQDRNIIEDFLNRF